MKSDARKDSATRLTALTLGVLIAVITAGGTVAGIQGSGLRRMAAIGTLDLSGGFVVNDVSYDETHARVTIDGHAGSLSQLRQGHVVTVKSSISADGTTATANEIALINDVRGAVTGVDASAGTVTVLSQTVHVADAATLASLSPGTEVSASGFANAAGELIASRIDTEPSGIAAQARGRVAHLDTTTQSFELNGLAVDYSSAEVVGPLAAGTVVTAQGSAADGGRTLLATRIDVASSLGMPGDRGDIAGLITRFVSRSDFDVNGVHVVGDDRTRYPSQSALGLDRPVRVKGRFDSSGALVADQIQTKAHGRAKR